MTRLVGNFSFCASYEEINYHFKNLLKLGFARAVIKLYLQTFCTLSNPQTIVLHIKNAFVIPYAT